MFRDPDGGRNNLNIPSLGRAGEAYARSVPNHHPFPVNALPEPDIIFDELLKATGEVKTCLNIFFKFLRVLTGAHCLRPLASISPRRKFFPHLFLCFHRHPLSL